MAATHMTKIEKSYLMKNSIDFQKFFDQGLRPQLEIFEPFSLGLILKKLRFHPQRVEDSIKLTSLQMEKKEVVIFLK